MEAKLLGVCAWISQKLKVDVVWVRIAWVTLTILGFGSMVLVYFIIYFLLRLGWIE